MRNTLIILILIVLLPLPVNALTTTTDPSNIVVEDFATIEGNAWPGQIVLEEMQRMGANELLVMPSGVGPNLGEDIDVIRKELKYAQWTGGKLEVISIKDRSSVSIEDTGALEISLWLDEELLFKGILGATEYTEYSLGIELPVGNNTLLAITADREVPSPMVPIDIDLFLDVQLLLTMQWILTWEVTYLVPETTTPTTSPEEVGPTLNIEMMIIFVGGCGLLCAALASRRKKEVLP